MSLRYLTAGESHGPANVAIIEGFWSNVRIDHRLIDKELARRQQGYGRGKRMKIERDQVEFMAGIRYGYTLGSPIAIKISNRDYANWKEAMNPYLEDDWRTGKTEGKKEALRSITRPRPGHADLPGAMKYRQSDIRNILERSSARETAVRTAVGALCKNLLYKLGISINSHVVRIGEIAESCEKRNFARKDLVNNGVSEKADLSSVRALDDQITRQMIAHIDCAKEQGDSLGGSFEIIIDNIPPGLGSHVHPDRKFDSRLTGALMSLQGIKGVEIGAGFNAASMLGSQMHDDIYYQPDKGIFREKNNAGGIEGGISNGEPVVLHVGMKPIPTLSKPLDSVDIETKKAFQAQVERADVCAVPAASIVAENIVAFEITRTIKEKFGGDAWGELKANYQTYLNYLHEKYNFQLKIE